jgi:type I restriction enzyme S subunit
MSNGSLPSNWSVEKLSDLGTEVRGSARPVPSQKYELYSVPAFPIGQPEVLEGSQIGSIKRVVAPGDVLICKINPRINRVWLVKESSSGLDQIASTEWLVLRLRRPYPLAKYLTWYLRAPTFRDWIQLNVEGATGSHTRAKSPSILRQLVPIPPVEEQTRIVAAIEEQFSRLDHVQNLLVSAAHRTKVLRDSLLHRAFAGPWPRASVVEIAQVVSGQTPKGLASAPGGNIPFYKVGDMNNASHRVMGHAREYLDFTSVKNFKLHIRPPGTVIFPKRGGAIATNKKRILSESAVFDLNTMGLIPGETLEPRYLLNWLETIDLSTLADGSSVPQINHGDIASLQIPLPPRAVQRELIAELERQFSILDSLTETVDHALIRAESLRASILERAFSGRLVLHDPGDESASASVTRIDDEHAATTPQPRRTRR